MPWRYPSAEQPHSIRRVSPSIWWNTSHWHRVAMIYRCGYLSSSKGFDFRVPGYLPCYSLQYWGLFMVLGHHVEGTGALSLTGRG